MRDARRRQWADRFLSAAIGAIAAPGLLWLQSLPKWLEHGVWPMPSVEWPLWLMGADMPRSPWIMVQQAIDWWNWHPYWTLAIAGAAVGLLLWSMTERFRRDPRAA